MASSPSFHPEGQWPGETVQACNARMVSAIASKKMALAYVERGDAMRAGPLFLAAARAGEVESMEWAAQYSRAIGSDDDAIEWFTRSASAGVRDSMYNLANRLVERGLLSDALGWYKKAADAGDTDAAAIVDKLRRNTSITD